MERKDKEISDSERLARIDQKVDFLVNAEQDKEKRIRVLEARLAYGLGGAGVLSFLAPVILKKLFGL